MSALVSGGMGKCCGEPEPVAIRDEFGPFPGVLLYCRQCMEFYGVEVAGHEFTSPVRTPEVDE